MKYFLILLLLIVSFASGYLYRNQRLITTYSDKIIKAVQGLRPINVQIVVPSDLNPMPAAKRPVASQPVPTKTKATNWTGPEFWAAITAKRKEQGLSAIPVSDLLCTLAAIRLAEVRRLGRLDDHDEFRPLVDKYKEDLNREDLLNLFEFLTSGAPTAKEAVDGLYNTLGHKALFTEIYKAGCAYAADGFGVVITSK